MSPNIPNDPPPTPKKSPKQSKLEYNSDSKSRRQQRNNNKVLMRHWENRKRQYSISSRKQYQKLKRDVRRLLAEAGYSEAELLTVLIGLELIKPGVQRIKELPPELLRRPRDDWDNCQADLRLHLAKIS